MKKTLPFILLILLAACAQPTPVAETPLAPLPLATNTPNPIDLKGAHDGALNDVDADECRAYGWAVDANQPDRDLQIRLVVDGKTIAEAPADQYRLDLATFNRCPEGTCAFDFDLSDLLAPDQPHTIWVQALDESSGTWLDLDKSPRTLTCQQPGVGSLGGTPEISSHPSGRVRFEVGDNYLILEFLDDDLLHFEISGLATETDLSQPLPVSLMIAKSDYPGPSRLEFNGQDTFETAEMRVQVNPQTLCLSAWDISRQPELPLTTLCPSNLAQPNQGFSLTPETFTHIYGLGQAFVASGQTDGDWVGRVRAPGSSMGNAMVGWNGGGVGNTQFPILYFAGDGLESYALFADNAYTQSWNFRGDTWKVSMGGNWMRFYLMTGPDFQDLRQDYLELTGHPTIPPKKAFGLWVSEYGYDNWGELEDKLRTLRQNNFPVDGFVLDLQWFGGVQGSSDDSRMGSLDWDLVNFPDPAGKIAELGAQGIGLVAIEEPYISRGLPEHAQLAELGYLAKACRTCPPTYLTSNPWWGQGGMLDWSNPEAGAYWHDWKREPLIEAGLIGHWTDLGEPEMYDPNSWYFGIPNDYTALERQADVHNLYNLLWSKSVYDGYSRNAHEQRPFILSRSGAPGSQRYGVAMWSADIGSNLVSLAAHLNVQMHMSLSGMDYFGSDIGGFHRGGLDGNLDEMYTRWFASSTLTDVPVRVHTENLCNCKETAPDRIGDLESNQANIRLRYALSPYIYSLSHRAYRYGEPVFPPLVYYYQQDPNARELGSIKLIGRDLLTVHSANYTTTAVPVYLPAGEWYDYHSNSAITSTGQEIGPVLLYRDGLFRPPLFARAGAIIPQMHVDEKTLNIFGLRSDGTRRDELVVRVFASPEPTTFTLYEDDGATIAYQSGAVRETLLSQAQNATAAQVVVGAAQGGYNGAPESRAITVEWVSVAAASVTEVRLNGAAIPAVSSLSAWQNQSGPAWFYAGDNLILVKTAEMPVSSETIFTFE